MFVSILTVEIMFVCHWSANPAAQMGRYRWSSSANREACAWLRDHGLIDENFRATERGRAWIEAICATPLPASPNLAPTAGWCELSQQLRG